MKTRIAFFMCIGLVLIGICGIGSFQKFDFKNDFTIGQKIDSLNGVYVFYNGNVSHVMGRNTTKDGYNLGLKYQCVEFVKRYYYEYFNHKMPDSYGHAKDFYDKSLKDGYLSKKRALTQYSNPSNSKPAINDLLIFDATPYNPYGHVAIISKVFQNEIEIIQQNPGPYQSSRTKIPLENKAGLWKIENNQILGWLRK